MKYRRDRAEMGFRCPTCHMRPCRVLRTVTVGEDCYRRRRCTRGHEFWTEEIVRIAGRPITKKIERAFAQLRQLEAELNRLAEQVSMPTGGKAN